MGALIDIEEFFLIGDLVSPDAMNHYFSGVYRTSFDIDPSLRSTILQPNGNNYDFFIAKWSTSPDTCEGLVAAIDSIQDVSCTSDGYALGHAEGGTPPYTYSWNTVPTASDSFAYINDGGIYELWVQDSTGCATGTEVWINAPGAPAGQDLRVNLTTTPFRPGFNTTIWVDAFNDGCISVTGQVSLVLDSLVSLDISSPFPDTIQGDTLIWNVSNMTADSPHFQATIQVAVGTQAMIGDRICLDAFISPEVNDISKINNTRQFCRDVLNSYDPNDKQVAPQGACESGYVLKDEPLTYTVRFQNTGNADAINISILDSLDINLDLSSIKVVGQSHTPMITEVLEDRILRFRFDNIHLPDSTTDESNSHGYVMFEVTPLSNLPTGTEVHNTAGIYFDFNDPIITNTVRNTLVDVIPELDASVENMGAMLIANQSPANGVSYQWLDCDKDHSPISGATQQSFTPTVNGNYAVRISQNDCFVTSECQSVSSVGFDEEFLSELNYYPNPNQGMLIIDLPSMNPVVWVEVFNLMGQKIRLARFDHVQKVQFRMPEKSGNYFVKVKAGAQEALFPCNSEIVRVFNSN